MSDEGFREAERLAHEGKLEAAHKILTGMDRDLEAGCLYVSVARMLGYKNLAEKELEAILSEEPAHPRGNHLRAMELLEAKRFDAAEVCLRKAEEGYASRRVGELSELYTDWGNLHFERKDTIKAVLSWRRALKLFPDNDIAQKNLARFEDVRFGDSVTINEMIQQARHPSQVLAHLMRSQEFKTHAEAEQFADYIMNLWNQTPRAELGGKTPRERAEQGSEKGR